MKHTTFFFIGVFLLVVAFFHGLLYTYFPSVFEPIHRFITDLGPAILYIAGFLALEIAIFTWLPTEISLVLFVVLILISGFYLRDKNVSFRAEDGNFSLTVVKKTISTPLISAPLIPPPAVEVEKNQEKNK
jgi:hypothetical protein